MYVLKTIEECDDVRSHWMFASSPRWIVFIIATLRRALVPGSELTHLSRPHHRLPADSLCNTYLQTRKECIPIGCLPRALPLFHRNGGGGLHDRDPWTETENPPPRQRPPGQRPPGQRPPPYANKRFWKHHLRKKKQKINKTICHIKLIKSDIVSWWGKICEIYEVIITFCYMIKTIT